MSNKRNFDFQLVRFNFINILILALVLNGISSIVWAKNNPASIRFIDNLSKENIKKSPFLNLSSTVLDVVKEEKIEDWQLFYTNKKLRIWMATTAFPIEGQKEYAQPKGMHLYKNDIEVPFEKTAFLSEVIKTANRKEQYTWGWGSVGGEKVIEAEDLAFSSDSVVDNFSEALFYSNANISGDVWLASGPVTLKIVALGDKVNGIGPIMAIKMDGKVIAEQEVNATSHAPYTFEEDTTLGLHHFEIAFTNDLYDQKKGYDRNLKVDKITFQQQVPQKGLIYLIERNQNNSRENQVYSADYIKEIEKTTPETDLYYVQDKNIDKDLSAGENLYNLKKKVEIDDEIRKVITAPSASRLEFDLDIPEGAMLEFGFGIMEEAWDKKGDGVVFDVYLQDKQQKHKLFSRYINPKKFKDDQRWFDECIDLSLYRGQAAKIVFETSGQADNDYDYSVWSNPSLFTKERENAYNVILISIDTLRADHLSTYGYKRNSSPEIDKMALDSVLFENAIAQSPWTAPSHMSMLTSLYPAEHGVIESNNKLPDHRITLAEILRQEGYNTLAFTGGGYVSDVYGFSQGFNQFYNYKESGHNPYEMAVIMKKLSSWLNKNKTRKFFVFMHTYQVHDPFIPPEPYDKLYADPNYNGKITGYITKSEEQAIAASSETDRKQLIALYDGEIKYMDKYIGLLCDELKELDLYDDTLIIFTSDHGEEFYEHGNWMHGVVLHKESIHVPLIVKLPAQSTSNRRVDNVVSGGIDIMPTILDVLGIDIPKFCSGISLVPLMDKKSSLQAEASVAFSGPARHTHRFAIRTNKYKYIMNTPKTYVKLFNIKNDPGEQKNLSSNPRKYFIERKLRKRLNGFASLEERPRDNQPGAAKEAGKNKVELDKETLERLKSLGYVQ